MIDLHAHVLPGIDDGPASTVAALELLRALIADGVETVAATPHVRDDFPTTPRQIAVALHALRDAASHEQLEIDILPGAEVALDRIRFAVDDGSLSAFALAGNPRYLLVEFPYHGWPPDLVDVVRGLVLQGMTPVLAHPERNATVQARPADVEALVQAGALVQVTASSLLGMHGSSVRKAATFLVERGFAHMLASDAHGAAVDRAGLSAARGVLRDDDLADWLTGGVPEAIVLDRELPHRPQTRAGGRHMLASVLHGKLFRRR